MQKSGPQKINISDFGAKGDGCYDNSQAFAKAFEAAKEYKSACLLLTKGVWKTGPIELFSNTELYIDKGAVLSFIPEPELCKPVFTRWEGVECYAMHPLIFACGQSGVRIRGEGCIDGCGEAWWNMQRDKHRRGQNTPETEQELALAALNYGYAKQPEGGGGRSMQFLRPPLIQFYKCHDVGIKGVSIRNSPFWTVHTLFSSRVNIQNICITNPKDAPNTDGIDIDSCVDVLIEDCRLSVGDDGIALKSGSGEDGIRVNKPVQGVRIRGCIVEKAHGGIVIGSETAGGIFDVIAQECVFNGTDRGIRIKTRRGRAGCISNISFRSVDMENTLCPIAVNMFYRCGAFLEDGFFSLDALPVTELTPSINGLYFEDIHAKGCRVLCRYFSNIPIPMLCLRSTSSVEVGPCPGSTI